MQIGTSQNPTMPALGIHLFPRWDLSAGGLCFCADSCGEDACVRTGPDHVAALAPLAVRNRLKAMRTGTLPTRMLPTAEQPRTFRSTVQSHSRTMIDTTAGALFLSAPRGQWAKRRRLWTHLEPLHAGPGCIQGSRVQGLTSINHACTSACGSFRLPHRQFLPSPVGELSDIQLSVCELS